MRRLIEQRYAQLFLKKHYDHHWSVFVRLFLVWHVVAGERSMFRLMSLERSIAKVSLQYDREHTRREQLELRVVKLRPGSIDPDLLEERARSVLGYARPDEQVVILPH